jgi:fatty-acyl-CoA synthase
MPFHFADITDAVAQAVQPDDPALIYDDTVISWGVFDARTTAAARGFVAAGVAPGDKIALLTRNHPAYLEAAYAGFKARLTHVNVNFRYSGPELLYIFDNSDAAIIVYHTEFAGEIAGLKDQLTKVKLFIEIGTDAPVNAFARTLEDVIASAPDVALPEGRSAHDDLIFIYTGGTTGMPKGVMWPHAVMWASLGAGSPMPGIPGPKSLEDLQVQIRSGIGRSRIYIAPPLMHGTGFMMSLNVLGRGGSVVMTSNRSFEPAAMLGAITRHRCELTVIVGDSFARPLARLLDERAQDYDLSSLMLVISSGAMWSPEVKAALLKHRPQMMLMDTLGSSEGVGIGMSMSGGQQVAEVGKFMRDPATTKVISDDMTEVQPGSGVIGRIARAGPLPLGYYKDPGKTEATYVVIDGVRYSMAGDFATVEADGTIRLLGRGSQSINTGGEKVFPEEVEEALKTHPAVDDALVVGVPDEKWGQMVTALVELAGSQLTVSEDELRQHVRAQLAGYKTPKRVVVVAKVPRGPNGKADYKAAKDLAITAVSAAAAA